MGEEIWDQTGGRVDAFVHCGRDEAFAARCGDACCDGTILTHGSSPWSRANLLCCPAAQPGAHKIEGIGIGYVPPHVGSGVVDEVVAISTADAEAMARRLARGGLFAGTSSGANVLAADSSGSSTRSRARRVATLLVDSGLKYLSTGVFKRPDHGRAT